MAKTTKNTESKTIGAAGAAASAKKKTASKKSPVKQSGSKKAVAKKSTEKKPAEGKAAGVKKATARSTAATRTPDAARRAITTADRHQMIAEAAYLRGESQGFLSDEREDWLLAEAEVDARLAKGKVVVEG